MFAIVTETTTHYIECVLFDFGRKEMQWYFLMITCVLL